MNARRWIGNSLVFHRRSHAACAAATAVATAILAGATLTGEALNRDLARLSFERIGKVRSAIDLSGQMVDVRLADAVQRASGGTVAPVLRVNGMLVRRADGEDADAIGSVRVLGADERLLRLFDADAAGADLLLSRRLAAAAGLELPAPHNTARVHLSADSRPALRLAKPSAFPVDLPLGDRRNPGLIRRALPTLGVLADARLGRFSLDASQIPPLNAVVDRNWLANAVAAPGQANLFVSDLEPAVLAASIRAEWRPSDVGIRIGEATNGCRLVLSDRLYLPEIVVDAFGRIEPPPVFSLHHLADAFEAWDGARVTASTPYGFVAALTPHADGRLGVVPAGMADDEALINAWTADKLALTPGGTLRLRWRRFDPGGELVPKTADLRVAGVLPMESLADERARLPVFPGLSDVDRCADWDIGLPMDEAKLADPDNEAYWREYGPTPKIFITLAAGRRMFGTAFGAATGARLATEVSDVRIEAAWREVPPETVGLATRDISAEARFAVDGAMDFKQLFLGMACVLLVAALMLVALLAALGVDGRRVEIGALRACGVSARGVLGLWLAESAIVVAVGGAAGAAGGWFFARALIWALNRHWAGAAPGMRVAFDAAPTAWAVAASAACLLSLVSVWLGVRRVCRMNTHALMTANASEEAGWLTGACRLAHPIRMMPILLATAAVVARLAGHRAGPGAAGGLFFGSGLLLLAALLAAGYATMRKWAGTGPSRARGGIWRLGAMGVLRRPGRNLLVAALLAVGCFLSVGVLSMRHNPAAEGDDRESGSGGFTWMLSTTDAVPADRADALVSDMEAVSESVVALRVHEGAEAGCNNLNRTERPRVLGIDVEKGLANGTFGVGERERRLLTELRADGCVPALAGDLTTVQYGLAATADPEHGSIFVYSDARAPARRIRLVGALPVRTGILQGSLIVDVRRFAELFPHAAGYRLWLIRRGDGDRATALARYSQLLGNRGLERVATAERLADLGAVEAAYLHMFLVLGGLGTVLGAAGVGLIVLRHAYERRTELAMLRAVGWSRRQVAVSMLAEHGGVLLFGLGAGAIAAWVAIQPSLSAARHSVPVGAAAVLLLAMLTSGVCWTLLAVWAATRGETLKALREE